MITDLNSITQQIIGAAIEVHRHLGPGLLESTYEACLAHELMERGFSVKCQLKLPVVYKAIRLDAGYRIDMLVNEQVLVEIKSVDKLIPIHEAQLLSYLKLSDRKLGLLINFNMLLLKDGIKRIANGPLDQ